MQTRARKPTFVEKLSKDGKLSVKYKLMRIGYEGAMKEDCTERMKVHEPFFLESKSLSGLRRPDQIQRLEHSSRVGGCRMEQFLDRRLDTLHSSS